MRFLIFNLVVVGALFYLFAGGQTSNTLDKDGVLHKVTMAAKGTVEAGRQATAAVIDKVMRREAPPPPPPSAPPQSAPPPSAIVPAPIQTPPIEVATRTVVPMLIQPKLAVPTAPAIRQDSARTTTPSLIPPPIDDPAVEQRRAEVLATGPVAAVNGQQNFMSPSQRQQELHALSEEMELLFASSRMQ